MEEKREQIMSLFKTVGVPEDELYDMYNQMVVEFSELGLPVTAIQVGNLEIRLVDKTKYDPFQGMLQDMLIIYSLEIKVTYNHLEFELLHEYRHN